MNVRPLARLAAAASLALFSPLAASDFANPTMGPLTASAGPRNHPNLSLAAAPRSKDADREEAHEGARYWKAVRDEAARRKPNELPPDLERLIAKAFHEKRMEAKERGPKALASVGWRSLGPTNHSGRVVQ